MNDTGNGYAYADQRAAEVAASRYRYEQIEMVERMREVAEATNSLALMRLVEAEEARMRNINW